MKKYLFFLLCIALLSLAGCTPREVKVGTAHLAIKKTDYPLLLWKSDGSHMETVTGSLLLGDKPIEKAIIQIGDKFATTNKKGVFEYNVDQSKLSNKEINVSNVKKALVDGKRLTKKEKQTLVQANQKIKVYYPIKIISEKENNGKNILSAQVLTEKKSSYPTVRTGKYAIMGTVRDAEGNPVKDAIVSITREKGEGWAHSNASDDKGHYLLAYLPENDEESTFRVSVGDVQYTLPDGKVYQFPDKTSSQVDVMLPKSGTLINDKPPTLISKVISGAMKSGIIIGIDGLSPKDYSITVPNDDGHFEVIVPTELWKKNPSFFEKKVEEYYHGELNTEDFIPKEWLKERNPKEPNGIKTIR
jgi:hypothetical protein